MQKPLSVPTAPQKHAQDAHTHDVAGPVPGLAPAFSDAFSTAVSRQAALAHDARNVLASLELFSGLLGEPGVMMPEHGTMAGDLLLVTRALSRIIERLAEESLPNQNRGLIPAPVLLHSGAATGVQRPVGEKSNGAVQPPAEVPVPVFVREPLRPFQRLVASAAGWAAEVAPRLPLGAASGRGGLAPVAPARSGADTGTRAGRVYSDPARRQGLYEDIGTSVRNAERLLAALAGPSVTLHVSAEQGLGPIALAGEDLTRVLINLVRNASESMPAGGTITITVRRAPGSNPAALVAIQDTGSGIPAAKLSHIFKAGFSSKEDFRREGDFNPGSSPVHSGLGLTIVRQLVEGAGGAVRVTSSLQTGTMFELMFPALER